MNQDGTDKQQVTHMSATAIFPDFSPDEQIMLSLARFDFRPRHLCRQQRRQRPSPG